VVFCPLGPAVELVGPDAAAPASLAADELSFSAPFLDEVALFRLFLPSSEGLIRS
jgi:hypothetical protein